MKIVFLDLDGVVVNTLGSMIYSSGIIEQRSVALLNKALKDLDAKIVISSSWRICADILSMSKYLELMGFDTGLLYYDHKYWQTDNYTGIRGVQIDRWLEHNPGVKNYVIIDDDSDMLEHQLKRFIHVDGLEGFGVRDYFRLINLMQNNDPCDYERPFKNRGRSAHLVPYCDK